MKKNRLLPSFRRNLRRLMMPVAMCSVALMAASCSKATDDDGTALPEGKYPMEIASVAMNVESSSEPWGKETPQTRVTENDDRTGSVWQDGDKIKVQIGNGMPGTYTYNQDGSLTVAEGDAPAYWTSTAGGQTIRAWYYTNPTKPNPESAEGNAVILSDQTNGLAYVVTAQETADFNKQVSLTFSHALAKVRVRLSGSKAANVTSVSINNYTSCTVTNGTVMGREKGYISMYRVTGNNNTTYWEANVVPQPEGSIDLSDFIKLNGSVQAAISGITKLEAGHLYIIDLSVNNSLLIVTTTTTDSYNYNGLDMQIGTWKDGTQDTLATVRISDGKAAFPVDDKLKGLKGDDRIWVCIPRVVKFFHTLTAMEVAGKALTLPDKNLGSTLLQDEAFKAGNNYYKNDWIVALYMGVNKNGATTSDSGDGAIPLYWATGNLIATKTNAANSGATKTFFHIATQAEAKSEVVSNDTLYTPTGSSADSSDGYAACALGSQWDKFGWGDVTGLKTSTKKDDYASAVTSAGLSISGDADYDIACRQLGGSWRLPTHGGNLLSELSAFIDNIFSDLLPNGENWERSQNSYLGRQYTHTIEDAGSAGNTVTNTLAFPAAGYRYGANLNQIYRSHGFYWGATMGESSYPHFLNLDSRGAYGNGSNSRFFGYAVRPVSE